MNTLALMIVVGMVMFFIGWAVGRSTAVHEILMLKRALGKERQMQEMERAHREAMRINEPVIPVDPSDRFIPDGLRSIPNSAERRALRARASEQEGSL